MLRVSDSELKLTSQGYHFDDHGKKFVRIFTSLNFIKVQIKIQAHKEMHIKAIRADFQYKITDNWVEMLIPYTDIPHAWRFVESYIDERCKEVWFV